MLTNNTQIKGLTEDQVTTSREKHGSNQLHYKKDSGLLNMLKSIVGEPMVILLLITSSIYFFTGNTGDGIFLACAIIFVAAISIFQDSRSRLALKRLRQFTKPLCKVIRNGETRQINSTDVVVGDFLIIEEGTTIAADGTIIRSNDFSVNESILTGESFSVEKDANKGNNQVFMGTMVTGGLAIIEVTKTGNQTELGKIGKSLEEVEKEKTPLQTQINNFVKKMVVAGVIIFLIVWGLNYLRSQDILDSLLKALTLAMSILPEEIPVAFATFMAMGAWRLMKTGVVVKQMKTVEALGSATVICADKTGTITENRMSLAKIYTPQNHIKEPEAELNEQEKELIRVAMWASEPIPFDPMEVALHEQYAKLYPQDERPSFKMVHEYPLGGKPPMMTHIFENKKGERIIAAKGGSEAILNVSALSENKKENISKTVSKIASEGYRVLGVGLCTDHTGEFPKKQQDFKFNFLGLVAFYDPPKKNISKVFKDFYNAGIKVKIITGDNANTTNAIAKQVNFKGYEKSISGEELMQIPEAQLSSRLKDIQIFTRMFPEAKLKVINSLKRAQEVVAMTGDGVNDAPALKAAHIGIAMGKKGSEIAKQAASLILVEDDLGKMVDAVAMGRKIYSNLKKAIQYIISIHIPIILTVFLPLILGWKYPNIFSPVHIIFLELIMGPTCSIIYENEPMEKSTMSRKPRPISNTFFNWQELANSIIQGLTITGGTLLVYRYAVGESFDETNTRTMVFITLIAANIFLTLINRSFTHSIFTTIRYRNPLVPVIIGITLILSTLLLVVPDFRNFFGFSPLNSSQLVVSISAGFISTFWFEIPKFIRRKAKLAEM
ncbi:cation-translocating P-type ATPase [Salegentibacter chungangensis]|uniref:Cation-translocating P-type ATPase n=1 Tax=Salegentibacter chungangensis TaxID=1335724 RepID=A0ABW3NU61_9FLAO